MEITDPAPPSVAALSLSNTTNDSQKKGHKFFTYRASRFCLVVITLYLDGLLSVRFLFAILTAHECVGANLLTKPTNRSERAETVSEEAMKQPII
jgi:hypothetical protein